MLYVVSDSRKMNVKSILIVGLLFWNIIGFGQSVKEEFKAAIVSDNPTELKQIAERLSKSYSSFAYAYYGLLLSNLPKNTVLLTNSKDDSFPLRIIQISKNYRLDVQIISLGMLADSSYRVYINKRHGLNLRQETKEVHAKKILKHLKNVSVSTTVQNNIWYSSSFYLTGLVVERNALDQLKKLQTFYSEYSKLKLLSYAFNSSDKMIVKNVLPPLITLYRLNNNLPKLKTDILQLAEFVGKEKQVKEILERE